MVFKRVLKGIGRLMLTTAVMCGVGLFLCSSEVKADPSVTLSKVEDEGEHKGDFKVTLTLDNVSDVTGSDIKVKLFKSSNMLLYEATVTKPTETSCNYYISATDFINSSVSGSETVKANWNTLLGSSSETSITIDEVGVYQEDGTTLIASGSCSVSSNTIHKVVVTRDDSTGVAFKPDFTDKSLYSIGGKNRQYGYEGESYTITPAMDGFDTNQYYDLVKNTVDYVVRNSADPKWKLAGDITGTISKTQAKNEFTVAYLPKINKINIVSATLGNLSSAKDRLEIVTSGTNSVNSTITYEIGELGADKEVSKPALKDYFFTAGVSFSPSTLGTFGADITDIVAGKCKVTTSLINTSTSGSGTVTISAKLGGESNIIDVASVNLPVSVGVNVDGINLQNQSGSIIAGGTKEFSNFISSISPAGASQDLLAYNFNVTEEGSEQYLEKVEFDSSTNKLTIKAKEGVSGKTATVKITLTNGTKNFDNTFKVNIVSFDKAKTISSINNSKKNYITYNKDKGYSLDIKQLIIDNAKDSSGNAITISKDQITEIMVGGSSCDGSWKPSEAALNKKVTCKINGVAITESDDLKVSAYPMPTATYSSSNRTLSVKIPTKVATAYSDDNNIRQSKGFKLILEDSSGNTLYEYTDSKYQNVLSSSSESTVTYTVPAADIEGMVTSAASNGKFSADTTSVKFKVIPMGYKQSSTSDETIKAKDEIVGKTDAVTVYKVSASGTNFTSSAAYGLDGQTVSITATPNSGYSFKQWSDGNTSNPRQVKVSASGTRSFQAVAGDRVANSTGAGGTDNSELYDDVPKTAESNSAIWLIVFMVFAVMGTTYALYLQLKAANSKHDR